MNMPTPAVTHNAAAHRFEVQVDGQLAHCDYWMQDSVMTLQHTEVPSALEGRGIAGALVKAAFAYARAQDLRVVPACSYVRAYVERHPETQDLLVPA